MMAEASRAQGDDAMVVRTAMIQQRQHRRHGPRRRRRAVSTNDADNTAHRRSAGLLLCRKRVAHLTVPLGPVFWTAMQTLEILAQHGEHDGVLEAPVLEDQLAQDALLDHADLAVAGQRDH